MTSGTFYVLKYVLLSSKNHAIFSAHEYPHFAIIDVDFLVFKKVIDFRCSILVSHVHFGAFLSSLVQKLCFNSN